MIASAVASPAQTFPHRSISWFAVAIVALVWLELVSRLRLEWSINPQYGYGWTVPFLTAFIFWRRWATAPAVRSRRTKILPTLALIAGALLLIPVRLIQEANPDWRLMSWAMAIAVALITAAIFYLAGGFPWVRHFAFPILFFLVAVPWPTQFEQLIIQGLMRADTAINVEVLNAIGVPAVQLGNVIEVGSGFVGIDEACTGIRSLQATFMVSLFLGELYDFSIGRRLVLVIVGAVVAFVCNLTRTFLLVFVGAERGVDAIKQWHDPAGLSILLICLFVLWGLSMLLRGKNNSAQVSSPPRDANSFPIPRAILFGVLIAVLAAEIGTQVWYRSHESASSRLPAWSVTWPMHAPNFKSMPVAEQAQELLRYNEGGGGAWTTIDGHQWGMYFFRWLPGRTAGLFIKNHRPDICLPASGMKQIGSEQRKLFTVNGVPLPIRSYLFDNNGTPLYVYYCYWDGTVPSAATINQENWTASGRLQAVRDGRREVGAQMLELVAWGYEQDQAAEQAVRNQLENIIRRG
jgi:exosortase